MIQKLIGRSLHLERVGLSGVLRLGAPPIINSESPTFQHAVTWGVICANALCLRQRCYFYGVVDGRKMCHRRLKNNQGITYARTYFFQMDEYDSATVNRASLFFCFLQPTSRDVVSGCAYMNIFVASNTPRRLFCSISRSNIDA